MIRPTSKAKGGQRIHNPTRRSGGTDSPFPGHIHAYNRLIFDDLARNKYLLTLIDHFTEYVEAFPIPDQTAETCARVYATQIITRHGTGSTLITDQGRSLISSFFKETRRILGIRRVYISSYHPSSNGMIERWHRSFYTGRSQYIDSVNTNLDVLVTFYLMAYRATPNKTTGYSPAWKGNDITQQ